MMTIRLAILVGVIILGGLSLRSTNSISWEASETLSSNTTGGGNMTYSPDFSGPGLLVLFILVIVVPVVLIVVVNLVMAGRD